MPTNVFGAFRTDTDLSANDVTFDPTGVVFEISAYSQITIGDGADATIIDGDDQNNEFPNDPTQTFNGNVIFWDFTIEVTDGTNTYQIGIFDYDIDGNGNSNVINAESGFFIGFLDGSVPPLNTPLTVNGVIDNGPDIDVDTVVPCFVSGTLVETPDGPRLIDDLTPGDLVLTQDNGAQPIRWIGKRSLDKIDLTLKPKLRPIHIARDALGQGVPARDLCVSPQHRMLVRSAIAARMFAKDEVFVPACKLLDLPGVSVQTGGATVTYIHLLLDRHEVIFAEGAPTESLFTGPEALRAIGKDGVEELRQILPQLFVSSYQPEPARLVPRRGRQMRNLVQRHVKNGKPVVQRKAQANRVG